MTPTTAQERDACAVPSPVDEAQRKLAVLIDADNAQPCITPALLAEIANLGVACVRRAYGDWTRQDLAGWKDMLHAHSLLPIQQFQYTNGKNSTDCALIIDAMDLMHTGRFDGFCLVSSDSDFTRLAARLREEGLVVYGFGERQKTPAAFVSACTRFIYTEVLRPQAQQPETPDAPISADAAEPSKPVKLVKDSGKTTIAPGAGTVHAAQPTKIPTGASSKAAPPPNSPEKPKPNLERIRQAVQNSLNDSGWATLSSVGDKLGKIQPDFDSRLHGYSKLSGLMRAYPKVFEVRELATPRGGKALHVRNKPGK